MKFRYLPMTEDDKKAMLATIGVESVEDLFADIPQAVRFTGRLNLPEPLAEPDLVRHMRALAAKNTTLHQIVSFLGAGVYEHYIPSVVHHVISRSEFYTAYTPYQPEISQGELQAIFEFQTMICELTGMDVANSSVYDGYTAIAEAANLAFGHTKRPKMVVSRTVHPQAREILRTYTKGLGFTVVEVPARDGLTDLEALREAVDGETAAVIVQYPNFFGCIEDLSAIAPIAHEQGALFVVSANPLALAILEPPGAFGADIVVGDTQPLGIPPSFGGPHCGYFAVKSALVRKIPGRIVGQTVDREGRRGFVLTLQAREQHIRREKATSNICSNQALMALASAVFLSALGKRGLQELALLNVHKAHYAKQQIERLPGYAVPFSAPFFNEFVVRTPRPARDVIQALLAKGILAGYDLGRDDPQLEDHLLVAVTDARTKAEIDQFARELEGLA